MSEAVKLRKVIYREYIAQNPSDGFSACSISPLKELTFTDPRPNAEWDYYLLSQVDVGEAGRPVCVNLDHPNPHPIYNWQCHRWLMGGGQYLFQFTGDVIVEEIVDAGEAEPLSSAVIDMEGEGGVDIPTLSLYDGNYQGGWFATFDILQFDSSIISADFQSNPTRYSFGNFSYQYHGHTVLESKVEMRKMYLPLHTWFPTLEPAGTPQDTNVWIPVPTWERSTGLKWHLHPSVTGKCRVWWMKLWSGFDAYF